MRDIGSLLLGAAFVGAAALLSSGLLPEVGRAPEALHVLGHLVICGTIAAANRGSVGSALTWVLAAGIGIELAQGIGAGRLPGPEAAYDVMVDVVGGLLGIVLSRPGRSAADALGWLLHPLLVAPLGVFGLVYAETRSLAEALRWTGAGAACALFPIAGWLLGLASGRLSDPDLQQAHERPRLFLLGCACVAAFFTATREAPAALALCATAALLCAPVVTLLTSAGLKVSGHAAAPVLLATSLSTVSVRGPLLGAAVAILVSWARVRAGRHTRGEVLAAWLLAAGSVLLAAR